VENPVENVQNPCHRPILPLIHKNTVECKNEYSDEYTQNNVLLLLITQLKAQGVVFLNLQRMAVGFPGSSWTDPRKIQVFLKKDKFPLDFSR